MKTEKLLNICFFFQILVAAPNKISGLKRLRLMVLEHLFVVEKQIAFAVQNFGDGRWINLEG
jgi:hypothetical protein